MNYSDILKNAPRYLSMRYNSLNNYVWENLFSEDYRKKILSKFDTASERKIEYARMKSLSDEATIIVFIFVIRTFFSEGSRMAKNTVDALKEFNINGFNLGKTVFSDRNENVVLGDELANKLFNILNDKARAVIVDSDHIYEILEKYRIIRDEIYE